MAAGTASAIGVRLYDDGRLIWARGAAGTIPIGSWALIEMVNGLDAGLVIALAVALPKESSLELAVVARQLTPDEQTRLRELEAAGAAAVEHALTLARSLDGAPRILQARYSYAGDRLTLVYGGAPTAASLERLVSGLTERLGCQVTPRAAEAATGFTGGTGRVRLAGCCSEEALVAGAPCERLALPPARGSAIPYLNALVDTPLGSGRVISVEPGVDVARIALPGYVEPVAVPLADLRPHLDAT